MTRPAAEDLVAARRLYSRLLRLYPAAHRDLFGEQMLRTFEDHYRDASSATGRAPLTFWIGVFADEGRSLLREHLSGVMGIMLGVWLYVVLIVPHVVPRHEGWALVAPVVVTSLLFLTSRGLAAMTRALLAASWFAMVAVVAAESESIADAMDLIAPALLLLCLLFSLKAMAGWHATLNGSRVTGSIAELAYSVPIGAAGIIGLALNSTAVDNDASVKLIFYSLIPVLAAVAGFMVGRRQRSALAALYSALATVLTGAALWLLFRPLIVQLSATSGFFNPQSSSALALGGWHRDLGPILLIAGLLAMAGATLGQIVQTESRQPSRALS